MQNLKFHRIQKKKKTSLNQLNKTPLLIWQTPNPIEQDGPS